MSAWPVTVNPGPSFRKRIDSPGPKDLEWSNSCDLSKREGPPRLAPPPAQGFPIQKGSPYGGTSHGELRPQTLIRSEQKAPLHAVREHPRDASLFSPKKQDSEGCTK